MDPILETATALAEHEDLQPWQHFSRSQRGLPAKRRRKQSAAGKESAASEKNLHDIAERTDLVHQMNFAYNELHDGNTEEKAKRYQTLRKKWVDSGWVLSSEEWKKWPTLEEYKKQFVSGESGDETGGVAPPRLDVDPVMVKRAAALRGRMGSRWRPCKCPRCRGRPRRPPPGISGRTHRSPAAAGDRCR